MQMMSHKIFVAFIQNLELDRSRGHLSAFCDEAAIRPVKVKRKGQGPNMLRLEMMFSCV